MSAKKSTTEASTENPNNDATTEAQDTQDSLDTQEPKTDSISGDASEAYQAKVLRLSNVRTKPMINTNNVERTESKGAKVEVSCNEGDWARLKDGNYIMKSLIKPC